jgi:hypothetical protein
MGNTGSLSRVAPDTQPGAQLQPTLAGPEIDSSGTAQSARTTKTIRNDLNLQNLLSVSRPPSGAFHTAIFIVVPHRLDEVTGWIPSMFERLFAGTHASCWFPLDSMRTCRAGHSRRCPPLPAGVESQQRPSSGRVHGRHGSGVRPNAWAGTGHYAVRGVP